MAFGREKNGDYAACLKYSVRIFVAKIFVVSGAVRRINRSLGFKGFTLLQKRC